MDVEGASSNYNKRKGEFFAKKSLSFGGFIRLLQKPGKAQFEGRKALHEETDKTLP